MDELTIGEVARQAGLRTSTLRYYEEMGLLPASRRMPGGHRRYDARVFDQLAVLKLAQEAGCSIAEMRQLVAGFSEEALASERWHLLTRQKLQEVEATIVQAQHRKRLLEQLAQCQCLRLEECVQRCMSAPTYS